MSVHCCTRKESLRLRSQVFILKIKSLNLVKSFKSWKTLFKTKNLKKCNSFVYRKIYFTIFNWRIWKKKKLNKLLRRCLKKLRPILNFQNFSQSEDKNLEIKIPTEKNSQKKIFLIPSYYTRVLTFIIL